MSVMRYFSIVLENNPNSEFKPVTELSVNPAIDYNIPLINNLKIAVLFVNSIFKYKLDQLEIKSMDEY